MIKSKGGIRRLFLINYISIFIALVLAIMIFIGVLAMQVSHSYKSNEEKIKKMELTDKYKDLDIQEIINNGGWVEKIKDNKIIEIYGEQKDNFIEYNMEYILNSIETFNKYKFKLYKDFDNNNESIYYLVKVPNIAYINNLDKLPKKKLLYIIIHSSIISLIFLALIIAIIGSISISVINKPIIKIQWAIKEFINGNYRVRLNFRSYKELNALRDTFNYMVEKIQESEEEKQKVEESKKRIIRNMAHDIKTPITSIMGYSKALLEEKEKNEEERKTYLGYVYKKTERLNYLVNELFNYSKLDSSNYKIHKKEVDLTDFVLDIAAFYYGDIERNKFKLNLDVPEKVINISMDEKEMERAFGNLIINALNYNPEETEITIALREEENIAIVEVMDNGVGINENVIKDIFNEFIRGDEARSSSGGGGLGLAITKRIIELHKGKISVYSQEGKGTTFIIELPLIDK